MSEPVEAAAAPAAQPRTSTSTSATTSMQRRQSKAALVSVHARRSSSGRHTLWSLRSHFIALLGVLLALIFLVLVSLVPMDETWTNGTGDTNGTWTRYGGLLAPADHFALHAAVYVVALLLVGNILLLAALENGAGERCASACPCQPARRAHALSAAPRLRCHGVAGAAPVPLAAGRWRRPAEPSTTVHRPRAQRGRWPAHRREQQPARRPARGQI